MILTVVQSSLDAYYGITRERTVLDGVAQTLLNSREELLGNGAAYYGDIEL